MKIDIPNIDSISIQEARQYTAKIRERLPFSDAEILMAALDIFSRESLEHHHVHSDARTEQEQEQDFTTVCGELWAFAVCLNEREGRTS